MQLACHFVSHSTGPMESHWPSSSKPLAQVGCGPEAKGLLVVSNHSVGLAMGLACTTISSTSFSMQLIYMYGSRYPIIWGTNLTTHLVLQCTILYNPMGFAFDLSLPKPALVRWPNHPTNRVFLIEVWTWIIVTFCSLVPNHTDSLVRVVHSLRLLLLLLNCYYILVVAYPWWLINEMFVLC